MTPEEENIGIDDISFEDVLGVGSATPPEPAAPVAEETPEADAEVSKEEEVEEVEDTIEEDDLDEEEYEEEEEETEEDKVLDESIVGEVLSSLGFELDEEYEDTPEGLAKMTQDLGAKMAEDQLDQLFGNFPLIQEHLNYVLAGGDSQQFMKAYDPDNDYGTLEISDNDIRTQRSVLATYFKAKGHEDEFINELLEDYEDNGKLFSKASQAKKALAQSQASYRQEIVEKQKEEQKTKMQEQQEFWNGVYETIDNSDEFAGLRVPKREKSKFFDYLSKPITKDGHTQRDLDHKDSDMEVKLAIDYLMFKGFNLDKVISGKAKTAATKSLKDRIARGQETLKSARRASRGKNQAFDVDELDLNL
tara:strand:- start:790 stop:1875 length:1086 start_codon:yes stop_codon:yes gene_type:complete